MRVSLDAAVSLAAFSHVMPEQQLIFATANSLAAVSQASHSQASHEQLSQLTSPLTQQSQPTSH
ncbi:MAG: hypothetical protein CMM00_03885 [Rhodopirellula sp.]|nr:hypothetical protein [Rhodopirellula sp.]